MRIREIISVVTTQSIFTYGYILFSFLFLLGKNAFTEINQLNVKDENNTLKCNVLKTKLKTSSIKNVESIFCFTVIENGWVLLFD